MTRTQSLWFVAGATLLVAVAGVLVSLIAPQPNGNFKDATVVLTLAPAMAVAIERAIETFWTVVGMSASDWWPFNPITREINQLVAELDTNLSSFFAEADAAMQKVATAESWTQEKVASARQELSDLQARLTRLQQMSADSQTVSLIANTAHQGVSYLQQKYPELAQAGAVTAQAVDGLVNFAATAKDNPARTLISIYLGALIGIVGAGVLGLDLFRAVLQPSGMAGKPYLGIAFTGLVIGLGATPTHELIQALQEYKSSQKAKNTLQPPPNSPNA